MVASLRSASLHPLSSCSLSWQRNYWLSVAVALSCLLLGKPALADTMTPALPGAATDAFSGEYDIGTNGSWNGHDPTGSDLTDQDLNTFGNTTNSPTQDVGAAVYAAPSNAPVNNSAALGLISNVNTFRIWGQPEYNSSDITQAYVIPPETISVYDNYKSGGNPESFAFGPGSFNNELYIVAVNGVSIAPTLSLTLLDPSQQTSPTDNPSYQGLYEGPVADGFSSSNGAYYADVTVAYLPTGTGNDLISSNGFFFDLGYSPSRTDGNGGLLVNEIQAFQETIPESVPEPTSLTLLALSASTLLLRRRPKTTS